MKVLRALVTVSLAIMIVLPSVAQKRSKDQKGKKEYKLHLFKKPTDITTDDISISMKDAMAESEVIKFRAKVTNNTEDFIIWDLGQASIKANGESKATTKTKAVVIGPFKDKGKTLEIVGSGLKVDEFSANLGGFVRVPVKGKTMSAPDFALPASQNSFSTGPFSCNMTHLKKKTDLTTARFDCTYKGKTYGLIDPSKVAVRMSNGQEFANVMRKEKSHLLKRGEKEKFTLYFEVPAKVEDMQFANMQIVWNDCFVESKGVDLKTPTADFELDPGLTEGKN